MTDARLPERWLNDRRLQRLSADHYRSFVNTLLWSVANRTDGRVESADLVLIPHWSGNAAKAFVEAGLFTPRPDGWLITDYAMTQTSRDDLEHLERMREADRRRKRRKRAESGDIPPDSPDDIPPDGSGGRSGGDSTGRQAGRQEGQERGAAGAAVACCRERGEARLAWCWS